MHAQHLYEYAIIRIVPRVEREEFINVGIILFSKKAKYIKSMYYLNENKIKLYSSEIDINDWINNLEAFIRISEGNNRAGRIALMDIPERFRWLTAVRSSSIQTSRPHPGFSTNLDKTINDLFEQLVL